MRFPASAAAVSLTALAFSLLAAPRPAAAQSGFVIVDARASIFGANPTDPTGSIDSTGLTPTGLSLTPGLNRILTFSSITGAVNPGVSFGGPDGALYVGTGVNISSYNGISGTIDDNNREMALFGVFTDGTFGTAPARLNFSGNHSFLSLTPLINQSFFVGDGLTGTGSGTIQQFLVPDGATTLYLGFDDAYNNGLFLPFVGAPSSYDDNSGSLTAAYNVTVTAAVPEPGTFALLGTGLLPLAGVLRRRRRA